MPELASMKSMQKSRCVTGCHDRLRGKKTPRQCCLSHEKLRTTRREPVPSSGMSMGTNGSHTLRDSGIGNDGSWGVTWCMGW